MLETPTKPARGVVQIAAATCNATLGSLLIAAGSASMVFITFVAIDVADQTWASLGSQITAQLGADVAALFASFQIDLAVILTSVAQQNNLPEFGPWVRQALGLLAVLSAAVGLAGAAPLWISRAIWRGHSRQSVLAFGLLVSAMGIIGLLITGAPQLIWGLVLACGLLTVVASRARSQSA